MGITFKLGLIFIIFISCQQPKFDEKVTIENKYSIDIPSFLSKAYDLVPGASLQYKNRMEEFYFVIMDQSYNDYKMIVTDNNLTDYYSLDFLGFNRFAVDGLTDGIRIYQSDEKEFTINNLKAIQTDVECNSENIDLYYICTNIKGKNRYYTIFTWTLLSKKEEHKMKMNKIINSFSEL